MTTTHKCERKPIMATLQNPYHFVESGLPEVYLSGIRYFQCGCGRTAAEIPALKQLLQLLARDLIHRPVALSGDEIRFLRKRLGKKQTDFADALGIEPETLSRIETGSQRAGERTDKLIRLYYAFSSGDAELVKGLQKAVQELLGGWTERQKPPKPVKAKFASPNWQTVAA